MRCITYLLCEYMCVCMHKYVCVQCVYVYICMCVCVCVCVCVFVCLPLPSNQSFYRLIAGYRIGVGYHKVPKG